MSLSQQGRSVFNLVDPGELPLIKMTGLPVNRYCTELGVMHKVCNRAVNGVITLHLIYDKSRALVSAIRRLRLYTAPLQ